MKNNKNSKSNTFIKKIKEPRSKYNRTYLDKLDPTFRHLTDLLFFTDRKDINIEDYKNLLIKSNHHKKYFWDRFEKSSQMFWHSDYWNHRINFLLSLNNKKIIKSIEEKIERRFFWFVKNTFKIDADNDIEYVQFLELCKVKKEKNYSLVEIKDKLANMPMYVSKNKMIFIVKSFIPVIFNSYDEYILMLFHSSRINSETIEFLLSLDEYQINFNPNTFKDFFLSILKGGKALTKKASHYLRRDRRVLLNLISNQFILNDLKKCWSTDLSADFLVILKTANYSELNIDYIKNIIALDVNIADDITNIYLDSLYSRFTTHKRSNVDKIVNLINKVPEISAKKVLSWMSMNNKNSDIKYLMKKFPDLKKLSMFA
jgi:hypothetical protein